MDRSELGSSSARSDGAARSKRDAEIQDLLAWAETMDGPCRTLDLAIAQALDQPWSCTDNPPTKPGGDWWPSNIRCARVTASTEAALALVESALPEANCAGFDKTPNGCDGYVSRNNVATGHWLSEASAKTPALSILVAFLKALPAPPRPDATVNDRGRDEPNKPQSTDRAPAAPPVGSAHEGGSHA